MGYDDLVSQSGAVRLKPAHYGCALRDAFNARLRDKAETVATCNSVILVVAANCRQPTEQYGSLSDLLTPGRSPPCAAAN